MKGLLFFEAEACSIKHFCVSLQISNETGSIMRSSAPSALNQHGYRRFTEDIDILMTKEGLRIFHEQLVGPGYRPAFQGATKQFKTTEENVRVEIVTSGEYPGDGLPKPVVFPDPSESVETIEGVRTITLEKLIELKLASGMTAADRLKDLADVQEVIKIKGLGPEFAAKLDVSVQAKFRELQQAVEWAKVRERGPDR